MGKRIPKLSDEWLNDVWTVRSVDGGEGELSHLDQLISSAVARCLAKENRAELAADLSNILGEEISVHMLNAYASGARTQHKIPASRFIALIGWTRRFDLLDAVVREAGGKALNEHQAKRYRIGEEYVAYIQAGRVLREDLEHLFAPFEP